MQVLRYANRVPLQFQPAACAITQAVIATNWRAYGLSQSRGQLPVGPITVMVHMASVWVPFTSESKEAIAAYPEIMKELRLACRPWAGSWRRYLNRRKRVHQEGERREMFLRYLGEVATRRRLNQGLRRASQKRPLCPAGRCREAQDGRCRYCSWTSGAKREPPRRNFGDNVLIVGPGRDDGEEAPSRTRLA